MSEQLLKQTTAAVAGIVGHLDDGQQAGEHGGRNRMVVLKAIAVERDDELQLNRTKRVRGQFGEHIGEKIGAALSQLQFSGSEREAERLN